MTYKQRLEVYERLKREIERDARTPEEYARRIRALADKLHI